MSDHCGVARELYSDDMFTDRRNVRHAAAVNLRLAEQEDRRAAARQLREHAADIAL